MTALVSLAATSAAEADLLRLTGDQVEDASLLQVYPNMSTPRPQYVKLRTNDSSSRLYLVKYPSLLEQLPSQARVTSVILSIKSYGLDDSIEGQIAVVPLARSWDVSSATFNRASGLAPWWQPGAQAIGLDHLASAQDALPYTGNSTFNFDVTDIVQRWHAGTVENNGLILLPWDGFDLKEGSPAVLFGSSASSSPVDLRPELTVEYELDWRRPEITSVSRRRHGWYTRMNRDSLEINGRSRAAREIVIGGANFSRSSLLMLSPSSDNGSGSKRLVFRFIDNNELRALIPSTVRDGTYDLTVANIFGISDVAEGAVHIRSENYERVRIVDISPTNIVTSDRSTTLTVRGLNFGPETEVMLAGKPLQNIRQVGQGEIEVQVPWFFAPPRRTYDLKVRNPDGSYDRRVGAITFNQWSQDGASCLLDGFEQYNDTSQLAGIDPYQSHDPQSEDVPDPSSPWMVYRPSNGPGYLALDEGDAAVGEKSMAVGVTEHSNAPNSSYIYYRYNNPDRAKTIPCAAGMNRLSFYVKLPAQWQTQPDKNYSFHVGDYPLQPVDDELPPADPQQEGRHFYYWQRLFGDDDGDGQPGWQRVEFNLITQHERDRPGDPGIFWWQLLLQTRFYLTGTPRQSLQDLPDLPVTEDNPLGTDFEVKYDEVRFSYEPDELKIESPSSSYSALYGRSLQMPVSLLNTSREDRQFDLRASCLGQYWTTEVYEDIDGDGSLSSSERSAVEDRRLATGEVFKGFVEVTIPDNSSLVGKSCEIGFWAEDQAQGSLDSGGIHARLTVVGTPEAQDLDGDGRPAIYAGNIR